MVFSLNKVESSCHVSRETQWVGWFVGWLFDGVISSLLVVVRVGVSRETLLFALRCL